MFFLLSIVGSFLSVSSENWLSFWVGMEVSTISFITLVVSDPGFVSKVSAWKYYVYQCVGSVLLFLPLVLCQGETSSPAILLSGLIGAALKLGLYPLQGWVPHVMENMDLSVLFLLGSIQKAAPLVAMFHFQERSTIFWCMLLVTACWVGLSSVGLYSVKQILALSSILMTAWLGFSLLSLSLAVWFFCVYSFHLLILLLTIGEFPFHGKVSALFLPSSGGKVSKSLALGAFIGLPPFGVFLMKLEVGALLTSGGALLPTLCMLLSSGLMLFAYIKMAIPVVLQKGVVGVTPFEIFLVLSLFFPIALL